MAGANDAAAAELAETETGDTGERLLEYLEQLRSDDASVRELGAAAIGMLAGASDNVEVALKIGVENALIACTRLGIVLGPSLTFWARLSRFLALLL